MVSDDVLAFLSKYIAKSPGNEIEQQGEAARLRRTLKFSLRSVGIFYGGDSEQSAIWLPTRGFVCTHE